MPLPRPPRSFLNYGTPTKTIEQLRPAKTSKPMSNFPDKPLYLTVQLFKNLIGQDRKSNQSWRGGSFLGTFSAVLP